MFGKRWMLRDRYGNDIYMSWEEIEVGAKVNQPGFRVIRKLLTDKRFDK
ncbi:MAG: hypothetical protein SVT56_12900 [Chloroflexota bacterium]|nr:hypothetical protein [Chloroflexota bacterium]